VWSHPEKLTPARIEVTENGRQLQILGEGGAFRFPCAPSDTVQVIAASAVFPDGRRAEAVVTRSGFGAEAEAAMTAVAVLSKPSEGGALPPTGTAAGKAFIATDVVETEMVFVLDPAADYQGLLNSPGAQPPKGSAWKQAVSAVVGVTRLWFVLPDARLSRVEGWLWTLFKLAATATGENPRLADAVAASGLVAAAGPRKRAVILVVGNGRDVDESLFTPEQARAYLSEVGVPLFVLRTGKARNDGWPPGTRVTTMHGFASALHEIRDEVLDQQIVWFRGARSLASIAASLPDGVEIAGWSADHQPDVGPDSDGPGDGDGAVNQKPAPTAGVFEERVEVSVVRILVTATDDAGHPVTDLTMDELAVTEDSRQATVIGLDPVRSLEGATQYDEVTAEATKAVRSPATGSLPVTVYVETCLAGSMSTAPTLAALARRARALSSLGPVDLVVARTDGVRSAGSSLTDEQQLQSALRELSDLPFSANAIERIRTEFIHDVEGFSKEPTSGGQKLPSDANVNAMDMLARRAIAQEEVLIRQALARLNDWAVTDATGEPGLLLVVGLGFDERPGDYYVRTIGETKPQLAASLAARLVDPGLQDEVSGLGRELGASGFTVYPVATRVAGKSNRAAEFSADGVGRSMNQGTAEFDLDFLLLDPVGPQRHLAAAGGGRVVGSGGDLDTILDSSAGWYLLTYQVSRPLDGDLHDLDLSVARPGIALGHAAVVRAGTSEGQSASRLRRLLAEPANDGEIEVDVSVGTPHEDGDGLVTAEVTVTIPVDAAIRLVGSGNPRKLRISIALEDGPGTPTIRHDLVMVTATQSGLYYTVPVQYSSDHARLAVTAEDLPSGIWGGSVRALPPP